MSDSRNPVFPSVEIGTEVRPPTVVTPDPSTLFARRARRFRDLAPDHQLAPWLRFLGDLSEAQHLIQTGLPDPLMPAADAIARSIEFGMPVLPRMPFAPDPAVTETIDRLLDRADRIAMPAPARAALKRLLGPRHGPTGASAPAKCRAGAPDRHPRLRRSRSNRQHSGRKHRRTRLHRRGVAGSPRPSRFPA